MKSPIVLLMSLFDDMKRLLPGVRGLDRDRITAEQRYKHEGDGFLTVALPSLCDALDMGLATGKFSCPPGFKTPKGRTIPAFLQGMFSEVFEPATGVLKVDSDSNMVKPMREILRHFKKLTLEDDQIKTLDRIAKSKFFEVDDASYSSDSFDERELFILDSVCSYVLPNIESFNVEELKFRHGPGSVFEGLSSNQKWVELVDQLDLLESYGFDCVLYQSLLDSQKHKDTVQSSTARLITVPKNSRSRRTITVEPLLNQFVQQGYNALLRREIERCSILRRCLALTDQKLNQKLALDGSRTDEWATIDLTSASDSLSVKMVSQVFKSKPFFLKGILECRSKEVLCDNVTRPIFKFAGMGNATTFPVQSVVFACLAIAALVSGVKPTYANVKRAALSVRVYGDDIIVPTNRAHLVVDWITKAGLKVNLGKSFLKGNFKESCGVDAWKGIDVTPLYVRCHPIKLSKKEPCTIAHYVSLCNQAWMRGLYSLSATYQQLAEEALGKRLPLTLSTSSVLGLHSRQETYEIHRWNRALQCPELRGHLLSPVYRKDAVDGYAALLKFYLTPFVEGVRRDFKRSPVRFKAKLSKRWVCSSQSIPDTLKGNNPYELNF